MGSWRVSMSLCRVGTTHRLGRVMVAELRMAAPVETMPAAPERKLGVQPSHSSRLVSDYLLELHFQVHAPDNLLKLLDSKASSTTSRPHVGSANDGTEPLRRRGAADAAEGPQAFPMMPATQQMMMPTQVPNILPMMNPQMVQGVYDIPSRMVECAGHGGICSLNWLLDDAHDQQR